MHYTSVVTNTGDLDKVNMIFKDAIPAGTQFVAGRVKIDDMSYPAGKIKQNRTMNVA